MKATNFTFALFTLQSYTLCVAWIFPTQNSKCTSTCLREVQTVEVDASISDSNPLSMRSLLIEKAKEIDEGIAGGQRVGTYSASGWSNRLGTVLTPVSIPGVYSADRAFYWNKIDVGGRMTVIRLSDGALWIHSPVALDEELKAVLDQTGPVKYVVSPNYEHLKYAAEWASAYPEAHMWGCPGLTERMPEVSWTGEIPTGFRPSEDSTLENCWNLQEIQPLHIDTEVNPFTGKPFFNEVVFYHQPSETLLTTDLFWNYPQSDGIPNSHLKETPISDWELAPRVAGIPFGSKAWKFGMDKIYLPFYNNCMVKDKDEFYQISKYIVETWAPKTLVPAHGDIIRGQSVIRDVLGAHLKV